MQQQMQQLCEILQATQDPARRVQAEQMLNKAKCTEGTQSMLLQIAGNEQVPDTLRIMGAIYLKNTTKNCWDAASDLVVPESDKVFIKQNIAPATLSAPPAVRRVLTDAVQSIADIDFPGNWPSLVNDLVATAGKAFASKSESLTYVLDLMHAVFERWQMDVLTEENKEHVLSLHKAVGMPLLHMFQYVTEEVAKPPGDAARANFLAEVARGCVSVFYDMTCLDLSQFFEDNLGLFMKAMLAMLKFDHPALHTAGEYHEGPLEKLRTATIEVLTFFLTRFDEDFQKEYLGPFTEVVWGMLSRMPEAVKYDEVAIAAMNFIASAAKSIHHSIFSSVDTLNTICDSIIIPSIKVRDSDAILFEEEPAEYIKRDIEGSDQHTRRRSALELTHALSKNYLQQVTGIFQQHVTNLLAQYAQTLDWKAKDCAIYLITALSIKMSASSAVRTGVQDSQLVNIADFFNQHVLPELQVQSVEAARSPQNPILKADAIKFVSTFRRQIPTQHYVDLISLLAHWVTCESEVVMAYAASTIERLLSEMGENQQEVVSKQALAPVTGVLFSNLFNAVLKEGENQYLMQCIQRVIMRQQELIGEYLQPIMQPLANIVVKVSENPTNPQYNHYLFESISAFIKYNPSQVALIEGAIFEKLAIILQKDVVEFMPYVFQIFAQMLELRQDLPESYSQLLPHLVNPTLYENKGNIPAIVRFLTVFTTKHPHHVVSTGLVDPILSIFAQLIESRSLDHEGFNIINSIVLHVPHDTVQTRMPMIMRLLFARLSKAKTVKYMKMLILFLSILVVTHGADWLIQAVEQLQANMWSMLFRNVWTANVRKVEGQSSTNVCQIALVKLLAESTFMKQPAQADLWVLGTRVLMAMVTNDSDVDHSQNHTEGKKYEFTSLVVAQLGSKYDEGYTNSYCPLKCAAPLPIDYSRGVDPSQYLCSQFSTLSQQPFPALQLASEQLPPKFVEALKQAGLYL